MEEVRHRKMVRRWLLSGCILIGLMVIIGGITRLTQSGLSMVKWEPVVGAIPPLNEKEWNEAFDLYKASPEYRHYRYDFHLDDFKRIFFWEYLHRLIARVIGLIFIVPCMWFWLRGYFDQKMKKRVVIIFLLGLLQGVMGWIMVKSGLADEPHVSHFRLAIHFMLALMLIAYIYWVYLDSGRRTLVRRKLPVSLWVFSGLLIIQLIYGAFVAGLKAGLIFNTFPLMGSSFYPEHLILVYQKTGALSFFTSAGHVQFIHRIIAFVLVLSFLYLLFDQRLKNLRRDIRRSISLLGVLLLTQFVFGVFTLVNGVPATLGVLHQLTALFIFIVVVHLFYQYRYQQ